MRRLPERTLRNQLLTYAHLCYERHLLVGMDGNLSTRLTDELVLCTQAGCHKGMLTDDDLIVITMDGNKVRGAGQPTSELAMHLACYRERPDIEAVLHAHPPICVGFTVAGISLAQCALPEVVLTLGTIPTLGYRTTGTDDLAHQVGAAMRHHDTVLMDHHGAVAVGTSLLDAFCKLETMEHTAKIMKTARDLGGIIPLPTDEAVKLRRMGLTRYGGPPAAQAMIDQPFVDLPEACQHCSGCGRPGAGPIAPKADFTVARLTGAKLP